MRIGGRPRPQPLGRDLDVRGRGQVQISGHRDRGDRSGCVAELDPQPAPLAVGGDRGLDGERARGEVRGDPQPPDVQRRHRLEPDRLPDAGGAGVVRAGAVVPGGLLAAGLHAVAAVAGPHHHPDLGAGPAGSEVGGEGGEAAAVPADLDAVDPDGGVVVDRAEVQQQPPVRPRHRHLDGAGVPDGLQEVGAPDAGCGRLGRERHRDPLGELPVQQSPLQAAVALIDLELPPAVEVHPLRAHALRARMLGTGQGFGPGRGPNRDHSRDHSGRSCRASPPASRPVRARIVRPRGVTLRV